MNGKLYALYWRSAPDLICAADLVSRTFCARRQRGRLPARLSREQMEQAAAILTG